MTQYRVLHDLEVWRLHNGDDAFVSWRSNKPVPEVFIFDQPAPTTLTKEWQFLVMDLNPGMTPAGFHSLFKWDRAFSNGGVGFEFPPGPPRRDWVSKLDLTAKDPRKDKTRTCGGAIIEGRQNGNTITVATLDGRKAPPKIEWLLDRPWLYFRALTVWPNGHTANFPQNGGRPVYIPFVASGKITCKLKHNLVSKPYPTLVKL